MNEQSIKKYAQIMEDLNLSALEITKFGQRVRLERNAGESHADHSTASTSYEQNEHVASAVQSAPLPTPAQEPVEDESIFTMPSPMIGAFYAAPAENQEPFINVGDSVKVGDVLCIIESMKLMNEICSDVDGTILEVCAANHQAVDFGHPLFKIKKEA